MFRKLSDKIQSYLKKKLKQDCALFIFARVNRQESNGPFSLISMRELKTVSKCKNYIIATYICTT